MGITDPDPAMATTDPDPATTVAMRPLTTIMARPPIMGADHIITADTDIAPAFPVSAVIRWPVGNSRVRNRPQGNPVPLPPLRTVSSVHCIQRGESPQIRDRNFLVSPVVDCVATPCRSMGAMTIKGG